MSNEQALRMIRVTHCWSDSEGERNPECRECFNNDGICDDECEYGIAIKALKNADTKTCY